MNEKPQTLKPLGRLCMTIGQLPASYVESMSYYEQLLWLTKFLQEQVIPVVNHNSNIVNELQDYVEHYFDNLDVQEEINNKLDEMAESGQLTDIIAQYLGLAGMITFVTIADMKEAQNLVNGSKCATLGYREANDNGNGIYLIRNITNEDHIDEGSIISLYDPDLVAELIAKDKVTPEMFGAYGDNTHDDTTYIQNALNYTKEVDFKNSTYLINDTLTLNDTNIIGNDSIIKANEFTAISMLNISNDIIIKNIKFDCNNQAESVIGDNSTGNNLEIENCTFTNSKADINESNFSLSSCVYLTAKNCNIKNSSFSNNRSHGCRLYAKEEHTIINIDNCNFNSNGDGDNIIALGLVQYGYDNGLLYDKVTISNCLAKNNSRSGIAPHSANNVIINHCVSNSNGEHGFCLMDGKNGTITDCQALNNGYYGVRIQGDYQNTTNPGYKNFVVANNYLRGGGVFIDHYIENGLIDNNLIISDTILEESKGIKLGNTTDNTAKVPIKNVVITNNKLMGFSGRNEIITFTNLDETNKFDNITQNLPSKSVGFTTAYSLLSCNHSDFRIGNTNNAIEDTIFDSWSVASGASISGNTLTPGATGYQMWKTINYSGEKYLAVVFDISGYASDGAYGVALRTRTSGGSLIAEKTFHYQYMVGNKLALLYDLSNIDFDYTNVGKLDIMLMANKTTQITINSCYVAYVNELPALKNVR